MKTLLIIFTAMLFMAGCTGVQYVHKTTAGEQIKVNYSNANIRLLTEGLKVTLPDGAILEIGKREQMPDSNSMKAIGEAVGVGVGAAITSGLLK